MTFASCVRRGCERSTDRKRAPQTRSRARALPPRRVRNFAERESAVDACRITHITVADRLANGVAKTAAREPTDALAVAVDRLAAEQRDRGVFDRKTDQQTRQWRRGGFFERFPPLKRQAGFQLDRPAEPGHRRV